MVYLPLKFLLTSAVALPTVYTLHFFPCYFFVEKTRSFVEENFPHSGFGCLNTCGVLTCSITLHISHKLVVTYRAVVLNFGWNLRITWRAFKYPDSQVTFQISEIRIHGWILGIDSLKNFPSDLVCSQDWELELVELYEIKVQFL